LLIALIACQSVLAFADSHETNITFSMIEVERDLIIRPIDKHDATQIVNPDICDHCGFCHHGQLITSLLPAPASPNTDTLTIQYIGVAPSGHLFSVYRPPKA